MSRRAALVSAAAWLILFLPGAPWLAAGPAAETVGHADIRGTATEPGRDPSGPPAPLAGLTVVLLPRSDGLLESLERVRARSRDSLAAYRSAIPEMRRLLEDASTAVRAEGRDADIRTSTVDGGRFSLPGVPLGDWILVAYRSTHVDRAGRDTARETGTFQPQPRLVGYDRVSMWLMPLSVAPGQPTVVAITDRNVWFEGVAEQTAAREVVPNTGGRRRSSR